MFPPFPQEAARHYCNKLISLIESGKVILQQCGRESEERKGQGLMLGALVCWNPKQKKRIVLYAVSGNNRILSGDCGDGVFVPSLVSVKDIDSALAENDKEIHELTDKINSITDKKSAERQVLCKKRTGLTDESLKKVFSLYTFTCFDGKKISLDEIVEQHGEKLPPAGTGDCCAPKLLSYAFENNLEIVSMDEVYFGRNTAHKKNGVSYPPCDERCGYILPYILGLEILYRDKELLVINKPSGLLSVPGRSAEKKDSSETRVRALFPQAPRQCAVHRLDMETSGILVLALTEKAHSRMNAQFAEGGVHKKYIALLDGILHGKPEGRTELPFRLDPDNRPHQIYDKENGKIGITLWKKLGVVSIRPSACSTTTTMTRIEFTPLTGRTHQLRLAASCSKELGGLGIPITGDTLYGKSIPGGRLMLHASEIEFHHPVSGELIHIICPPDF